MTEIDGARQVDLHIVTHVAGLSTRDLADMLLSTMTDRTPPAERLASKLIVKAIEREAIAATCVTDQFSAVHLQDAADLRDLAARLRMAMTT